MTIYTADLYSQDVICGTTAEIAAAFTNTPPDGGVGLSYVPRKRQVIVNTETGEIFVGDGTTSGSDLTPIPGATPSGPTTDVLPLWTVGPVDADAGHYQLASDGVLAFGSIAVGANQAAVQAAIDAGLVSLAGYGATATVTGNWAGFTVEFSHYFLGRSMYVNANTLTKAAVPVADPAIVLTERGHGQYVEMTGLYGEILGRAAPGSYSPFGGSTGVFMPQTSTHPYDGPFLNHTWSPGKLEIDFGSPFDLSDLQLKSSFDTAHRETEVNVQAYEDLQVKALEAKMHTEVQRDGSAQLGYFELVSASGDANVVGHWRVQLDDAGLTVLIKQNAGQSGTVLDVQDGAGLSLFSINADGNPVLKAPDGSYHKVLVSNIGVLSTAAA